jgi:hypothetical protein
MKCSVSRVRSAVGRPALRGRQRALPGLEEGVAPRMQDDGFKTEVDKDGWRH